MSIRFLNIEPSELSKYIFKYMGLSYAIESIDDDSLWFANPEKWNDPFESYFINNAYDTGDCPCDFPLKNNLYACCFSTISRSEAQWKMYSDNGMSLMFEIDVEKLLRKLDTLSDNYDVYVGKVVYLTTKDLLSVNVSDILKAGGFDSSQSDLEKALYLMLCKRKAFEYESEIRIFCVPQLSGVAVKDGVRIKVNLTEITRRYTISPVSKSLQNGIKHLLKSKGLQNVYCAKLYNTVVNKVLSW